MHENQMINAFMSNNITYILKCGYFLYIIYVVEYIRMYALLIKFMKTESNCCVINN